MAPAAGFGTPEAGVDGSSASEGLPAVGRPSSESSSGAASSAASIEGGNGPGEDPRDDPREDPRERGDDCPLGRGAGRGGGSDFNKGSLGGPATNGPTRGVALPPVSPHAGEKSSERPPSQETPLRAQGRPQPVGPLVAREGAGARGGGRARGAGGGGSRGYRGFEEARLEEARLEEVATPISPWDESLPVGNSVGNPDRASMWGPGARPPPSREPLSAGSLGLPGGSLGSGGFEGGEAGFELLDGMEDGDGSGLGMSLSEYASAEACSRLESRAAREQMRRREAQAAIDDAEAARRRERLHRIAAPPKVMPRKKPTAAVAADAPTAGMVLTMPTPDQQGQSGLIEGSRDGSGRMDPCGLHEAHLLTPGAARSDIHAGSISLPRIK